MGKIHQVSTDNSEQPILYVLDTNVLIHDPAAILEFEEHQRVASLL